MSTTKADLIAVLKSFIFGSKGAQLQQKAGTHELLTEDTGAHIREALREELGWNYIAEQNFLDHPNKNAQFTLRHRNWLVPAEPEVLWDDVNKCFEYVSPLTWYLKYVNSVTILFSKRAFEYGCFGYLLRVPDPAVDPAFYGISLGGEFTERNYGGWVAFSFENVAGVLHTYLRDNAINGTGSTSIDVSAIMPVDPTNGVHSYSVKVNRCSVEYYCDTSLLGIFQFASESDTYTVRTTAPYVLAQLKGQISRNLPAVMVWVCSAVGYIGKRSNIYFGGGPWIADGEPAPPRTLHPITGGVNWEGTAIAAGTLTSDRIPIAGYDKKTVLFLATGAGTLYIDMDYGDDSNDQYDSVAVAAGTLIAYPFPTSVNPLWLRLRFTPTGYPTTVTRARVSMS